MIVQMVIRSDLQGKDIRRYNKPTYSDIAVIIHGNWTENVKSRYLINKAYVNQRDIVINKQKDYDCKKTKRISELNVAYDTLT